MNKLHHVKLSLRIDIQKFYNKIINTICIIIINIKIICILMSISI